MLLDAGNLPDLARGCAVLGTGGGGDPETGWPLAGGRHGSPNYVEVIRADGSVEEYAVVTALEVNDGDVIGIHTATGGGYGEPRRRRWELVLEDLRNGYVTEETARTVYGLDI